MDSVEMWCALVVEIMETNDLRVPDPEPRESTDEELERIRGALRSGGYWLKDGCECAWVSDFERAFGKVTIATRRRWSELGLLSRVGGRFTPLVRRDAAVGRAFVFRLPAEEKSAKPAPAPDAGLAQLEAADHH